MSNKLLYKKMELDELIEHSKLQDYHAIEELLKRIQKDVFATLSYLLKNNDNLSDLTQEVLIKVAKYIQNLKNTKCFKSWLNQIITNTYNDYMRKNKKNFITVPLDCNCNDNENKIQFKFEIPDNKNKPIEKCITTECENFIKTAIRGLPEAFRLSIVLREFQGLSYDEIAKATNTNVGTVKSRISRARLKLQEVLKNYIY